MTSYLLPVVVQPDADAWRVYVPDLETRGAATWGKTKANALSNMREVAQMVVEVMVEDGEAIPPTVATSDGPMVVVSVE